MITPEGDAKLIDFGLAKNLWEVTQGNITGEGETLGTVGYMAPEQVKSAKHADHRADIYGLGSTLYHCLAGRPPFVDRNEKALAKAIAEAEPPALDRLSGVPLNVVAIVARMMQKRPEDRFQTPDEVLRAIENVVGDMLGIQGVKGNVEFLLKLRDEELDLQKTWRASLRPSAAFHGAFREQELVEFLQMVEFNQKTGILEVAGRAVRGRIYLSSGRIVAGEVFRLRDLGKSASGEEEPFARGAAAVNQLLMLTEGDFEFTPKPVEVEKECELNISKVLLDALRRRDERPPGVAPVL
jgi:serine/threonine protein kinase